MPSGSEINTAMVRLRRVETASVIGFLALCALGAGPESAPPDPVDVVEPSIGDVASVGPDVIVSTLLDSVQPYGSEDPSGTGDRISAFSIGTVSCNIGSQPLDWYQSPGSNQHPAIHQSMYRLKDNRFEQLGMGWIKHGFYALNESNCGLTCLAGANPPGTSLFVGCSDPYNAGLNGNRTYLGPTWEVNAFTGSFPANHTNPSTTTSVIANRLQVHDYDLDPALNAGAVYFVQGLYIHPDDAAAGNGNNNASYRKATVFVGNINTPTCPVGRYCGVLSGATQPMQSAIRAWKDTDSSVRETDVQVPGEGLFILAAKVTDLGTGFFHYEYALQNLNSDRSGGSFMVLVPEGVFVQNLGFHDVDYHDGEPWNGTDWPATVDVGKITWATTPYSVNPSANALRWSTLYNFRFDANVGPNDTTVTLGLFKPGLPPDVPIATIGPTIGFIDCNHNGIADLCDVDCGGLGCAPPCGGSLDCNDNRVPDECEDDCNGNGLPDTCDIASGFSQDCDANTVPDECEPDCDGDGIPDACETVTDTDGDGVTDCFDLCPTTTPVGACVPAQFVTCCFASGIYITNFSRSTCLSLHAIPVCDNPPRCPGTPCADSLCRNGCLVGDFDRDGDLDLFDIGALQSCFGGSIGDPAFVAPSAECLLRFDFDGDGDVDFVDYGEFFAAFTGP